MQMQAPIVAPVVKTSSTIRIYTVTPYRRPKRNLLTSPMMLWYIQAYRVTSAICFLFSMRYSMITTTKIKNIWKSVSKDR